MVVWMIGRSVAEKDCTRLRQFPEGFVSARVSPRLNVESERSGRVGRRAPSTPSEITCTVVIAVSTASHQSAYKRLLPLC